MALPTSSLAGGMRLGGDSKAKCGERRVPSLADLARLENNTHVLVPWAITNEKLHTEYCGGRETCAPAPQMAAGVSVGAHGAEAASAGNAAGISAGPAEALDSIASADKLEKLSEELTKLREMIAAVVTKQDSFVPMMAGGGGGLAPPPPPPPMPPNAARSVPGGPPPPPPPLPPPGFMLEKKQESMADLIKKNRKGQKVAARGPSMMDILSGIGSITLKKAGDRHQNSDGQADTAAPADPASMIAAALKRKFAHRANSSPSAETAAWAQREKDMAERKRLKMEADKPKFGLHMLKKKGGSKNRTPLSSMENSATTAS